MVNDPPVQREAVDPPPGHKPAAYLTKKMVSILHQAKAGKPKEFKQILTAVKLSHNTLRHHLDSLEEQKIITKSKQLVKRRGRPRFTYLGQSWHR